MAEPASEPAHIKVEDLEIHYGTVLAVKGVSFSVQAGEQLTLLGPSGCGKTTTLRAIMGLASRSRGLVEFDDFDLARCQPHEVPRRGIGYVPQGRGIFPNLTVQENLFIGLPGGRDQEREDYVFGCFPRLKERLKQSGNTLSGGEQQMLAIGRALMARPKLLLLDEPSMGLAPILVEQIFDIIKDINAAGTTVLLVEQNALMALGVADRGYVLETGSIVLEGDAKELQENELVRKTYLGQD